MALYTNPDSYTPAFLNKNHFIKKHYSPFRSPHPGLPADDIVKTAFNKALADIMSNKEINDYLVVLRSVKKQSIRSLLNTALNNQPEFEVLKLAQYLYPLTSQLNPISIDKFVKEGKYINNQSHYNLIALEMTFDQFCDKVNEIYKNGMDELVRYIECCYTGEYFDNVQAEMEQLTIENQELNAKVNLKQAEIEQMTVENQELTAKVNSKQAEIEQLTAEVNSKQAEIEKMNEDMKACRELPCSWGSACTMQYDLRNGVPKCTRSHRNLPRPVCEFSFINNTCPKTFDVDKNHFTAPCRRLHPTGTWNPNINQFESIKTTGICQHVGCNHTKCGYTTVPRDIHDRFIYQSGQSYYYLFCNAIGCNICKNIQGFAIPYHSCIIHTNKKI